MNVELRAKRILCALSNYIPREEMRSEEFFESELCGKFIGIYKNGGDIQPVFFFEKAIVYSGYKIFFEKIKKISLTDGKISKRLCLQMIDEEIIFLPIYGSRGDFYDSLEVLRFFDRVLSDIKDQREGSKLGSE